MRGGVFCFSLLVGAVNVILAETGLTGRTAYSDLPAGKFWIKATTFAEIGTTNLPNSDGLVPVCGGGAVGSTYYALYQCIPPICGGLQVRQRSHLHLTPQERPHPRLQQHFHPPLCTLPMGNQPLNHPPNLHPNHRCNLHLNLHPNHPHRYDSISFQTISAS